MQFRAGDDILARIRASLVRRHHGGRGAKCAAGPTPPPPGGDRTSQPPADEITYYGKLGEMGHPADRTYADDGEW